MKPEGDRIEPAAVCVAGRASAGPWLFYMAPKPLGYATWLVQEIEYAAILIAYAKESNQDYDELLIEKNRYGAVWLHFAVRPKENRRKVAFIIV